LVLLLLSLVAALSVAWYWREPLFGEWRRQRIRRQPFPAEWRQILRRRMPYFRTLPVDLQLQLKKRIQVFLAEKPFIGCAGLEVTDEMRVTIAAQRASWSSIAAANASPTCARSSSTRVLSLSTRFMRTARACCRSSVTALAGESWTLGQVVLSWEDALAGAETPDDGRNVVIHEFATSSTRRTAGPTARRRWPARRAGRAGRGCWAPSSKPCKQCVRDGRPMLFSSYGAGEPGRVLRCGFGGLLRATRAAAAGHPALYEVLSEFYRVDPSSW
jgi:Mlc titration factor MtfA (ptsG expression regulator)